MPDGRVQCRLKRPYSDGTQALVFEPLDFLARLAALVAPPRVHLVHYHGLLAPHAKDRDRVVPRAAATASGSEEGEGQSGAETTTPAAADRSGRLKWAELIKKTFAHDVLACECGGRRRFLCFVFDPRALAAIKASLQRKADRTRGSPQQQQLGAMPQ